MNSSDLVAARKRAREKTVGLEDLRDDVVRELVLRRRGASVSWYYKTRGRTIRLGDAHKLGLTDARAAARKIAADEDEVVEARQLEKEKRASLSFGELLDRFLSYRSMPRLKGGDLKQPKEHTLRDMRLSFGRAAVRTLRDRPVATLTTQDLRRAREEIQADHSPAQATKALAYIRSALKYGLNELPDETLLVEPFWQSVGGVELVGAEALEAAKRKRSLGNPDFGPAELREFIRIHLAYCDENRISFAVRYGMIFVMLSSGRSGSTIKLRKRDVHEWSGLPGADWRLAIWPSEIMKKDVEFALPLPPVLTKVVDLASNAPSRQIAPSQRTYVFESRPGRPLSESALRQHLARMRGWESDGKRKTKTGPDLLAHLPRFSIHSVRTSIATYLDDRVDVPPTASSAILNHVTKQQRANIEATSMTTQKHYSRAQRIRLKEIGMAAWLDAVAPPEIR